MRYTIATLDHGPHKEVVLSFFREEADGDALAAEVRFKGDQGRRPAALLVLLIEALQDAADDLQPGLFNPLPESDPNIPDAIRVWELAGEIGKQGKDYKVHQVRGVCQ